MYYILDQLQQKLLLKLQTMDIGGTFNAGGVEQNNGFKFLKQEWKKAPLEFHYEIQQNKKHPNNFYLRIDCHFSPYSNSKNLNKQEYISIYGQDNVDHRLKLMKDLNKNIRDCHESIRVLRKKWQYNSLWCTKWNLSQLQNIDETLSLILDIVEKTSIILDDTINNL